MEGWRSLAAVVVLCALLEILHGLPFNVDSDTRTPNAWEAEVRAVGPVGRMVALMKRSKAQQFYGLMGKRAGSMPPIQMNRRRNKGEMFVGLMGRSITSGESLPHIVTATARAAGCVRGAP